MVMKGKQAIRGTIDQVLALFSRAAEGMFEVTSRHLAEYEQGVYGCVTAKPSRRMRTALGVDRELLVVVSTFADQQQRTIKFVKQAIDQSLGRYESSIAIVVHSDPDGDAKLRNWGREQGISVLSVSTATLTRCVPGDRRDGQSSLEKVLCVVDYISPGSPTERRVGGVAGLKFDEEAARMVAKSTGNMPYWTRKCGSYIHRQIPVSERPCSLNAERIDPLVESFVVEEGGAIAEVALRHLFRVHPKLEQAAMQCYEEGAASVPATLMATLQRYGIVTGGHRIEGLMMKRGLSALRSAQQQATVGEETVGSVGELTSAIDNLREWAEELATLGSRRNVLERRLRGMFLNFIVLDRLKGAAGNLGVRERVMRGISEKRRKQLGHLAAEDLVAKFTWKELTEAIESKEWMLFERIFGDRKRFREMSDVVNDRFDAHAKQVDLADIALYRRALSYLEERIERIE